MIFSNLNPLFHKQRGRQYTLTFTNGEGTFVILKSGQTSRIRKTIKRLRPVASQLNLI